MGAPAGAGVWTQLWRGVVAYRVAALLPLHNRVELTRYAIERGIDADEPA